MLTKLVYRFGERNTEGNGSMKTLLGGKGANLAEMAKLALPVPAGFTITTEVCNSFYKNNKQYPQELKEQVDAALAYIEQSMDAKFGDIHNPLLLSCRSGARDSMPGMMDTVLNIGLNDETVKGLSQRTQNPRFAYDAYRRFIAMYGDVVMGIKAKSEKSEDPFDLIIQKVKNQKGYLSDTEMNVEDLQRLVEDFKALILERTGQVFPQSPQEQLWQAIGAVFESWMTPRAIVYRQIHHLSEDGGTAANVQAMVFGNMGDDSATGVGFSRNPANGENYFYGEYLINAQGEDVVAGLRTPAPLNYHNVVGQKAQKTLEELMPSTYVELIKVKDILENHYGDMQDIEFTIQQGKLWMLQCRNGKRTAQAALKIAVDLVNEGKITQEQAIMKMRPEQLNQLLLPAFAEDAVKEVIAHGLPASPGAAVGQIVFSAQDAEQWVVDGKPVILVRIETSPEDIKGMHVAEGILTARGGMTSHAAVVARGMGTPCVAGVQTMNVDYEKEQLITASGHVVKKGEWISLDGTTGDVIKGELPTMHSQLTGDFATFMGWADNIRTLQVRANADNAHDAEVAKKFGAQGIGLCRTEHMFFEEDRINVVRAMILANNRDERLLALAQLLEMQRHDFYSLFKSMSGLPVNIRTLDPPLHEFLPHHEHELQQVAKQMNVPAEKIRNKLNELVEVNPMLGLRGCRLGIVFPEITEMQIRAIIEAAMMAKKDGCHVAPEIMIPLVGSENEFSIQKQVVDRVANEVMQRLGDTISYQVGTMIELPRACFIADKIVEKGAQFFSFGTNDLTQTTFGLSRDDASKFIPNYLEQNIWEKDPFVSIDKDAVACLVKIAVEKGRSQNPSLKLGICGEHGGDPETIDFCYRQGLTYVSCSPYRVPIARLAAAQAVLRK